MPLAVAPCVCLVTFRLLFLRIISRMLVAGVHQGVQLPPMTMAPQPRTWPYGNIDPDDSSQQDSAHNEDSLLDDVDHREMEFSNNWGMLPDRPVFMDLSL